MVGVVVLLSGRPAFAECVTTIKYRDTPVCVDTFACTETPQSRFVREICYDVAKSYMLSPLVAHSGRAGQRLPRPLSGVKRTPTVRTVAAAFDPKRTLSLCCAG
jgi:hypothetical protein